MLDNYWLFSHATLDIGIIYIFGGIASSGFVQSIYVIDTTTNSVYISSASLTTSKFGIACVYYPLDDSIYCFGGQGGGGPFDTIEQSNFPLGMKIFF